MPGQYAKVEGGRQCGSDCRVIMMYVCCGGKLLWNFRDAIGRRDVNFALGWVTGAVGGRLGRCGRFAMLTVVNCDSVVFRMQSTYFPGVFWVNGVRFRACWLQFVRVMDRVVRVPFSGRCLVTV